MYKWTTTGAMVLFNIVKFYDILRVPASVFVIFETTYTVYVKCHHLFLSYFFFMKNDAKECMILENGTKNK